MAGFQQQYGDQFPGNSSPAAGAPWNAAASPAPHYPQSASPSYRLPPPGQPRDHAGVLRDAVLPSVDATGNRRPNEEREDMLQHVENLAAQPQGLQYVNMGYYDIANDHPAPQGHRDHIIGDDASIVQDVPVQAHVAPLAPEIDAFNDEIQQAAAGPAPLFLDEIPQQFPVPNGLASEVLRQLVLLYLHDPNSQVAGMYMEPGQVNEVMVIIALRLTNL